ncbi:ribonuclease D [Roseimaritima sediminicola]|uniref:ribonuclease D n=1 Tax=Roseimaritima sediminicola TaxID=2662066 RepID=UPI001EEE92A4|nr:HRDC domain-containing protein [Roseimaritima sediminicola]
MDQIDTVQHESITTREQLDQFCDTIAREDWIAFDTEFVSEDRYRPELCLLQIASGNRLAVVDPLTMPDTQPFWDLISTPGRTVIAHAAREEIRFCYRFTGKPIAGLFDVQLAAGFTGLEYPASLGTLVSRLEGKTLAKGESRTNWRHRPLSRHQIKYALQDVTELRSMQKKLAARVDQLQRQSWLEEEIADLQQAVINGEEQENWRRVSGMSGLSPRQMEIVRQVWLWREDRAQAVDQPPRRVLRDDLVIELAKRETDQVDRIRSVRGMERRNLARLYDEIAAAVRKALEVPEADLPKRPRSNRRRFSNLLAQFLSMSINCVCRQHQMAPAIVGNMENVRELVAYELSEQSSGKKPYLLQGWRAEVVGKSFRDLLAGNLAIRVADRDADDPLEFIEVNRP